MFICCDLKANREKKGECVSDLESMTYLQSCGKLIPRLHGNLHATWKRCVTTLLDVYSIVIVSSPGFPMRLLHGWRRTKRLDEFHFQQLKCPKSIARYNFVLFFLQGLGLIKFFKDLFHLQHNIILYFFLLLKQLIRYIWNRSLKNSILRKSLKVFQCISSTKNKHM